MIYEEKKDEILKCRTRGSGKVCTHYTWSRQIQATHSNGTLSCEYRYPDIPNTEWQGQIITDEQRPMYLHYDEESVEIPVTDGQASEEIDFPASGTYQLIVDMGNGVGCEPATLEVVIA